jgi:hypothetical protein
MLINFVGWFLFIVALASYPYLVLTVLALGLVAGLLTRRAVSSPSSSTATQKPMTGADHELPILNEDWIGEEVLSIDDLGIPPAVQAHGARFRKPARYVIELGLDEYALYAADGELLDLCFLE